MILRIDCPVCKRDSYSASVVDFRPCPYCGIAFSGKYGIEKRNALRLKKEIPVIFLYNNHESDATTIDLSPSGVSVRISNQVNIPVGDIITLKLGGSDLEAQVRWVKNGDHPSNTTTGFRIVRGAWSFLPLRINTTRGDQ